MYAVFTSLNNALLFREMVDGYLGYPKAPTANAGSGAHALYPAGITGHYADITPNQTGTLYALPVEERYRHLLPEGTPTISGIDDFYTGGLNGE